VKAFLLDAPKEACRLREKMRRGRRDKKIGKEGERNTKRGKKDAFLALADYSQPIR